MITGAASGIGRATAILFAHEGASLFCVDGNSSEATVEAIRKENLTAHYCLADIGDADQVRRAALECESIYGKVDVLFNNAGRTIRQTFEQTSEDAWAAMLSVNLTGAFLCSKYFLSMLKKSNAGSIINHASVDAMLGNPFIAAYAAAKGGLIPLTHVMAHDLGRYNIRVNCLSTGGISTPMTADTAQASRVSVTPLQRMGTPDEVARAALFLASHWSSFVNGANLVVDGGRTTITQGTYHG